MLEQPITIVVNGRELDEAEVTTVRVAIESFAMSLSAKNALGKDEHGRAMVAGYARNINMIRQKLYFAAVETG